jgi:hypothetical protein
VLSGPRPLQIAGAIGYVVLLIVSFLPQSLRPVDTIGYIGDSLDSVYAISRNAAVITSNPTQLFDANILYPHRESLALFGHRILLGFLAIRLADPGWQYAASSGDPTLASDLRTATFWTTDAGDPEGVYEVRFSPAVSVSGVVIPVDWRSGWPSQFRVDGRVQADGVWNRLASLDAGHVLQLVEQLLGSPGQGRIGFDLGDARLSGIRLRAASTSASKAWSVGEIEVWSK